MPGLPTFKSTGAAERLHKLPSLLRHHIPFLPAASLPQTPDKAGKFHLHLLFLSQRRSTQHSAVPSISATTADNLLGVAQPHIIVHHLLGYQARVRVEVFFLRQHWQTRNRKKDLHNSYSP